MRRMVVLFGLASIALSVAGSAQVRSEHKILCKTPAIAALCYWTHGRLGQTNGNPSFRVWKIGTKRKLGMFRGPNAEKLDPLDNEHPELPKNVERAMRASEYVFVFADFEVCPLEPERPGVKQYARIESAKNIAVGK